MDKITAQELYAEWKSRYFSPEMAADIQSAMEARVVLLHKELLGKRKSDANRAFQSLVSAGFEDTLKSTIKPYQDEFSVRYNGYKEATNEMEVELKSFSKTYTPEKLEEMTVIKSSSGGSYHTQGFGANKYARERLREDELLLNLLGYKAEIRDAGGHTSEGRYPMYYADYELWANITPFDYQMMQWGGGFFISVLNWAVLCWKRGTNPMVYFPFLSNDDYEKSQVLAYKKHYEITKENMMLEASWEEIKAMS